MYRERLDFIKQLALETGRLTLKGFGRSERIPKGGARGDDGAPEYDIATEYDYRAEELVKRRILDEFGEPVLGEEEGLIGERGAARRRLWIVDPIDGTFNYQRGLPLYAVSIGYCEEGVPVCGAIALPALGQLIYAAQGGGAYLVDGDGASPLPIQVSREREPARLVISLDGRTTYRLVAACGAGGIPWRSLRLSLCAAWSIAYVALGRVDLFSDSSLNLWDCAAGDIILREAGGPPTFDYGGTPIFPDFLNRYLDLGQERGFDLVAASSLALWQEQFSPLFTTAGPP